MVYQLHCTHLIGPSPLGQSVTRTNSDLTGTLPVHARLAAQWVYTASDTCCISTTAEMLLQITYKNSGHCEAEHPLKATNIQPQPAFTRGSTVNSHST